MPEQPSDELRQLREELRQLQQKLVMLNLRLDAIEKNRRAPATAAPSPALPSPTTPATPASAPVTPQQPMAVPPIISSVQQSSASQSVPPPPPPAAPAFANVPPPAPPPPQPTESFEVRFGTFWLPRIGMAVLLLGIVFLVTWSYQYMGAGGKVGLSYLCCAILGALSIWLERKTPQFARVMQAGAMALTYFVTYAAHFVPQFRVIESAVVGIALLAVVVAAIIAIAHWRQSAALAGMALFFGYFTSVMSGVAEFTLMSNAVLAVAALFFLWRNSWTAISFGAVAATYFSYLLWIGKGEFGIGSLFEREVMPPDEFWRRVSFLWLYWVLFAAGGLIARRETLGLVARNALLTLNNVFFFFFFAATVWQAEPEPWKFESVFALALAVAAGAAYLRLKPERGAAELLLLQSLAVGTLAVMDYFGGAQRVAALAVESLLIMLLARATGMRWIAWIGRGAFAVAALFAATLTPSAESEFLWGLWFTVAVGFVCAKLTGQSDKDDGTPQIHFTALYFAAVSALLGVRGVFAQFDGRELEWMWSAGAVAVLLFGLLLKSRETVWMSNVLLAAAHVAFWNGDWLLGSSLLLLAVTFGVGLSWWGWLRARESEQATAALAPYAVFSALAMMKATLEYAPERWMLTVFALEAVVLVAAGIFAAEALLVFCGAGLLVVGAGQFVIFGEGAGSVGWVNLLAGVVLLSASERLVRLKGGAVQNAESWQGWLRGAMAVLVTAVLIAGLWDLSERKYLTVAWAVAGFVLLGTGFAFRERAYRLAGFAMLALSLGRAVFYDMGKLDTPYRILSFIGLGAILLALGYLYAKNRERLAKWL